VDICLARGTKVVGRQGGIQGSFDVLLGIFADM